LENRITWQVTKGCERLSGGCDSCPSYLHSVKTGDDYSVQLCPEQLALPTMDNTPKIFAVAFGSDLFHESVPLDYIKKVFAVMNDTPQHTYELATKRIERASVLAERFEWTNNIHMGVTVESGEYDWRIKFLQSMPSAVKFISAAPMLGDMGDVDLTNIDYVGASKETWGLKRLFKKEWADKLSKLCEQQGVIFSLDSQYLWSAE
jgi:protein gp37